MGLRAHEKGSAEVRRGAWAREAGVDDLADASAELRMPLAPGSTPVFMHTVPGGAAVSGQIRMMAGA
ncbi:hypothetical protein LZ198_30690 [Myxococcus sp. K15C18031901]|uniref:hypothetical protein n=1 Tax=Myxococcus dinghuensis TaxID=2906761 RepID=UPI0020A7E22D|nr:hypothetical protein [Myxococcus dinghuensis]MCP3103257.1 hypothetical protein [Myxococcus dinghuensis]